LSHEDSQGHRHEKRMDQRDQTSLAADSRLIKLKRDHKRQGWW